MADDFEATSGRLIQGLDNLLTNYPDGVELTIAASQSQAQEFNEPTWRCVITVQGAQGVHAFHTFGDTALEVLNQALGEAHQGTAPGPND